MINWINFKELDFLDENLQSVNIDTRDFACSLNYVESDLRINELDSMKSDFFIDGSEMQDIINRLFEESGGEKSWRFLILEDVPHWGSWRLKYLRCLKRNNKWVVCDNKLFALTKSQLKSRFIPIEEYYRKEATKELKEMKENTENIYIMEAHRHSYTPITSPIRTKPKIQRNEPCPCGSGKKYKKCCISKDD